MHCEGQLQSQYRAYPSSGDASVISLPDLANPIPCMPIVPTMTVSIIGLSTSSTDPQRTRKLAPDPPELSLLSKVPTGKIQNSKNSDGLKQLGHFKQLILSEPTYHLHARQDES